MIKDFLIINCTGKNDKIGLKINNNFFIHDFQTKIKNNEILVSTILNLTNKYKANIDKHFTVLSRCVMYHTENISNYTNNISMFR